MYVVNSVVWPFNSSKSRSKIALHQTVLVSSHAFESFCSLVVPHKCTAKQQNKFLCVTSPYDKVDMHLLELLHDNIMMLVRTGS